MSSPNSRARSDLSHSDMAMALRSLWPKATISNPAMFRAAIWNARVTNVQLQPVPAGRTPNIRVYADNGWPRAQTTSLGNGRWWMGRQAVNQGYYQPRIAAHEFGHLLGLPDRRTGLCADLMSGSSAPVSCRNPNPNATEAATVNSNFRSAAARVSVPAGEFVWVG